MSTLSEVVVELAVTGTAVVTVRASSAAEAARLAEERCRPADVTELDHASAERVVRLPLGPPAEAAAERDRARERLSKVHERRASL